MFPHVFFFRWRAKRKHWVVRLWKLVLAETLSFTGGTTTRRFGLYLSTFSFKLLPKSRGNFLSSGEYCGLWTGCQPTDEWRRRCEQVWIESENVIFYCWCAKLGHTDEICVFWLELFIHFAKIEHNKNTLLNFLCAHDLLHLKFNLFRTVTIVPDFDMDKKTLFCTFLQVKAAIVANFH